MHSLHLPEHHCYRQREARCSPAEKISGTLCQIRCRPSTYLGMSSSWSNADAPTRRHTEGAPNLVQVRGMVSTWLRGTAAIGRTCPSVLRRISRSITSRRLMSWASPSARTVSCASRKQKASLFPTTSPTRSSRHAASDSTLQLAAGLSSSRSSRSERTTPREEVSPWRAPHNEEDLLELALEKVFEVSEARLMLGGGSGAIQL